MTTANKINIDANFFNTAYLPLFKNLSKVKVLKGGA